MSGILFAGMPVYGHVNPTLSVGEDLVRRGELRGALERIMTEPGLREAANAARISLRATVGYREAADEIQKEAARAAHIS